MRQVQCRHCLAFVTLAAASAKIPLRCPGCLQRLCVSRETNSTKSRPGPTIVSAGDRARNRLCSVCQRTLTLRQIARKCCDDPECRRVYLRERRKEDREKEERRLRRLAVLRGAAAQRFQQWSQHEVSDGSAVVSLAEPYSIALLPSNNLPLVRLPEERRQKLLEHLRQLVACAGELAEERGDSDIGRNESISSTPAPDELRKSAILAGACATCRGRCCGDGGEQAYLKATKIGRFIKNPQRDDEVPDAYMSYLPETSFEGSCVFHGETGCGLPRRIRSDTCCSFNCRELVRLRESFTPDQPRRVLAVATDSGLIIRMALLDGRTTGPCPMVIEPTG